MQSQSVESLSTRALPERAHRDITVLVNAAVSHGGRDGLCRIRNMSPSGLAMETSLPLTVGERAIIMLPSARKLACIVRWVRDGQAGLSCESDPTIHLHEMRADRATGPIGPTLPRFDRVAVASIRLHGRSHICMLDSISTGDVLLTRTPSLDVAERIGVIIDGLGELPASVCISQDGDMFARFTPHLPFRLMDTWLASTQS